MITTHDYLIEKYGIRMLLSDVSAELKVPVATLLNKRCAGRMPFATHRDGMRVFAFTADVAAHIESFRQPA
jgi:hypothetical protein